MQIFFTLKAEQVPSERDQRRLLTQKKIQVELILMDNNNAE